MLYKIYYGDDSTFNSDDGPPNLAPITNVQVIVQKYYFKNTDGDLIKSFNVNHNKDAFFWDHKSNSWLGTDSLGYWDLMYNMPNPKIVIFGRTISDDNFKTILKKAVNQGLN